MAIDVCDVCGEEKDMTACCVDCAAAAEDAMQAENARLKAIVDKLPKTVDGVAIVPGMELARLVTEDSGETWQVQDVAVIGVSEKGIRIGDVIVWNPELRHYSTREAAEAAKNS